MTGPVGEADFRRALASFATGVTVVTCVHDGIDHAMTANAVSSVSLRPPLVMVSIERTTRFWEAVRQERYWGMSVLAAGAQPHAVWLSTPGRPLPGQLDRVPHHRGERGVALVDDALAWLECRTYHTVIAGDHDILIGEVERATIGTPAEPLLYWRKAWWQLPDQRE